MNPSYRYENAAAVFEKLKSPIPAQLIDVRSLSEFKEGHARGAKSLPLDELSYEKLKSTTGIQDLEEQTVYLICTSGLRAQQAVDKLIAAGLNKLVVVKGGTSAWREANLPMIHISSLPSLERQTQVALGGLLVLLLIKGVFIHPLFYALIGFIGIGLMAAGVTAKCSLTGLMARMPWNRQQSKSPA